MDRYVVVEPTEGGKIVGVVVTVVGAMSDVVRLEAVAAPAPGDAAAAVAPGHVTAYGGWDDFGVVGRDDRLTILESDQLHRSGAQHLLERLGANPRTVLDLGTQLAAGVV
ncbi:MAG: hypothetical protein U9N84_03350, partial [Actinomycetota bacterium]|nr:hypothetical protein [Actinomycetota bacterium]